VSEVGVGLLNRQQFFVSGASPLADATVSLLAELGATVARGDLNDALTAECVVIHDAVATGIQDVAEYRRKLAGAESRSWVTVTARGLAGGASDEVADEAILQARGGLVGYTSDAETGTPAILPGMPATEAVAVVAAIAALHVRDRDSGPSQRTHLDVSAVEAVLAQGPVLELLHELMGCPGAPGSGRFGPPAGMYECLDGRILILAVEDHQRAAVIQTVAPADRAELWTSAVDTHAEEIGDHVRAWCSARSASEAERTLQANRVPASAVAAPDDVRRDEHVASRGLFDPEGVVRRAPMLPTVPAVPGRRRNAGDVRVLIAGAVLAIPLAGAILGVLGADVIRVEAPERLDVYRRNGPFIGGRRDIDNGAYFAGANHSMGSAAIDPIREQGRFQDFVAGADVVIENLGARVAGRWGVGREGLIRQAFGGLGVSSSGYGATGLKSAYRAYAYNIHASSGISFDTSTGRALDVRNAMADVATAYYVVMLVLAWASQRDRGPLHLDVAMTEVVAARALRQRDGHRASCIIETDEGHAVVSWARSQESIVTSAAGVDDLTELRTVFAGGDLSTVIRRLRGVGALVAPVVRAPQIVADEHLRRRGFFVTTKHPVAGAVELPGLPWVVDGEGRPPHGPIAPYASRASW